MKTDTQRAVISETELARLGGGEVAYIKPLTYMACRVLCPRVTNLPKSGPLFGLFSANGQIIAITDTVGAAVGHAEEGELAIAPLH